MSEIEVNAKEIESRLLYNIPKKCLDIENIDVTCEESAKKALSYTLQARKIKNQIEESRKQIVRPHIDFQKAVMKFAKDMSEEMEYIENQLHSKISDWMYDQKENPFSAVQEIEVEDGKIAFKKDWDFQIEDERLIPREYLSVDSGLIEKAIKLGFRNIPGLRIFSIEKTQLRVKN